MRNAPLTAGEWLPRCVATPYCFSLSARIACLHICIWVCALRQQMPVAERNLTSMKCSVCTYIP